MEIVQPGSAGEGVTSINTLTGDVILAAGTNITLVPVGNTVTINSMGGSGTPGGSDKQLQFNNAGAFGGAHIGYEGVGTSLYLTIEPTYDLTLQDNTGINKMIISPSIGVFIVSGITTPDGLSLTGSGLELLSATSMDFTTYTGLYKYFSGSVAKGIFDFNLMTSTDRTFAFPDKSGTVALISDVGITIGTTAITSGTTTRILYDNAGVVGEYTISGSGTVVAMATGANLTSPTITTKISPASNDGAPLGDTTHNFSDLFLASGAVINIANSDWIATHTSGILTVGTGDLRVTTAGSNTASVVTVGGLQTLTGKTLSGVTMADATNIILNATTGTKIGTATNQKLGFYNATPIVQPTGDVITALQNLGLGASLTVAATTITSRTLWGQTYDGSGNVTGSLTAVGNITGGASSMTITAGTGNSRTLALQSTTSGGSATTFLTGNADQSTTFAGTVVLGTNSITMTGSIAATGARVTKGWFTDLESTNMPTVGGTVILTSLTAPQFTTIELGAASDTTLSRVSAGVIAVEGVTVPTISSTSTITNKRNQPRIVSAASYTTDTGTSLDVSTTDLFVITAQAGALKFNNPSGTPVQGEKLMVRIKDNGTARALTYDTQFRASSDLALPTTTVLSKTLYMGFQYNSTDTKWDLLAVINNF